MTVGMQMMNQMFRDFKVAEDVGKMVELRRFEEEFELYATVYWENQQRYYLISRSEQTLAQHLSELELQEKYPLPLQVWTERSLVPAGAEEEIEQQIKINFAQNLRNTYSANLWNNIYKVIDCRGNDQGRVILDPLQEQIEGLFQSEQLQMFAGLLKLLYLRKNLTQNSFLAYQDWLRTEQQELAEQCNTKDIFGKDLFGIAYQNDQGQICYQINANRQILVSKKLKLEQTAHCLVAPIFQQKCWYNYEYRLEQARREFHNKLQNLYNEQYFVVLAQIQDLPVAANKKAYIQTFRGLESDALADVWRFFGQQLGIQV